MLTVSVWFEYNKICSSSFIRNSLGEITIGKLIALKIKILYSNIKNHNNNIVINNNNYLFIYLLLPLKVQKN